MSLIHRYKSNGFNIVLDINSGCIHLVDEVTYEVLPYLEEGLGTEAIAEKLENKYNREDIETSVRECNKLKEDGMLFTKDVYENVIEEFSNNRQTVVKALCLHIAHDCNLACRYCFAEEGEYHGRRALMSYEVGKKALDFLIANSGSRKNLEVDFFGGEPLMNWQVVKDLVKYGREQEKHQTAKTDHGASLQSGCCINKFYVMFSLRQRHTDKRLSKCLRLCLFSIHIHRPAIFPCNRKYEIPRFFHIDRTCDLPV